MKSKTNSPVQMWELVHKESWALKNWYFWTVVLEKTLETPLFCKDIKQVNFKGNKFWILIGRTDAEAPIFWPPDSKNWFIRKDLDAGKDWRREGKGTTGWDGWMASLMRWTWVWTGSRSWWWTGKPGMLQSVGLWRARHDWVTEMNWTELSTEEFMLLNCGVGEDSWDSLGLQGDPTSPF